MDFHALLAKLKQIDAPTLQECDNSSMPVPSTPGDTAPPPHPTMNVNVNAQGIDNIQDIFRLIRTVNPDATPSIGADMTSMPEMDMPTSDPMLSTSSDMDMPPADDMDMDMDMPPADDMDDLSDDLSDLDNEDDDLETLHDDEPMDLHDEYGDLDSDGKITNDDLPGDDEIILGDFDMKTDEDGGFQSSTTRPSERYKSMDYMNNELAGGMNGPKGSYPKAAGGDNPMALAMENQDLMNAALRFTFRHKLEEAKAKIQESRLDELSKSTLDSYANKASGQANRAGGAAKYLDRKAHDSEDYSHRHSNVPDPKVEYQGKAGRLADVSKRRFAGTQQAMRKGATPPSHQSRETQYTSKRLPGDLINDFE